MPQKIHEGLRHVLHERSQRLHLFLREKHRPLGVRFNSDTPSLLDLKTTLPDGQNIPYRLLSLPLYMVG